MVDVSRTADDKGLERAALRAGALLAMALFSSIVAYERMPGSIIALVPLGMLHLLTWPSPWRGESVIARVILLLAAGGTLGVAIDPGPLNLTIVSLSLGALALARKGDPLRNYLFSLATLMSRLILSPVLFGIGLWRTTARIRNSGQSQLDWQKLILPVGSLLVFAMLFAISNPAFEEIIRRALNIELSSEAIRTAAVAALVFCLLWSIDILRPDPLASSLDIQPTVPGWHTAIFSPGPVLATLVVLNGLFLLQNGLDARYIWSGMPMGSSGSYAEYAQRGAATLIITILLAALLVIFALWPGSRTSQSTSVRLLVYAWILQNGFLLASCVARLFSYVDAYGMTMWRLASLVWMALVGCGLVLVALRIVANRDNRWLINANVAAAFIVLWASGFADFKSIVADYNAGWSIHGKPYDDFAYLYELGPSALPALERLASKSGNQLANEAVVIRSQLALQQSDWRSWTLRGFWIQHRLSPEFPDLSPPEKSAIVQPCQLPDRTTGNSNPLPKSFGTNLPGAACREPNWLPSPE